MRSLLFLASVVGSIVSVTASPAFYLQIANGTHKGQYLTSPTYVTPESLPLDVAFGYVTWVNNLNNASIWTYYDYASGGGTGLALVDKQEVNIDYNGHNPSPEEVKIGDGHDPTSPNSEWGVQVVLDGWKSGAPSGACHERDDTLTQYRAFVIVNGHLAIAGYNQKGVEYIALNYLRIST